MRVVMKEEDLKESFDRATSEALTAFGNGSVFIGSTKRALLLDEPSAVFAYLSFG